MEPSSGSHQLILAKVYKWFNGASPYRALWRHKKAAMENVSAQTAGKILYVY
jgi:hypothetical protein